MGPQLIWKTNERAESQERRGSSLLKMKAIRWKSKYKKTEISWRQRSAVAFNNLPFSMKFIYMNIYIYCCLAAPRPNLGILKGPRTLTPAERLVGFELGTF